MRTARRALVAMALSLVGAWASGAFAREPSPPPTELPISPSWAKDTATPSFGFAPVTVTQSGVTYAPADPTGVQESESAAPLADLPAWAAPAQSSPKPRGVIESFGIGPFGNLPEPATWGLLLAGFAIIGGALRGLILANRRLDRLRADEEPDEKP